MWSCMRLEKQNAWWYSESPTANGNSAAGRTSMAQSASEQMLRVDAASSLHTRVANECKHEYKGESKGERYEVHTIIVLL